VASQKSKRSRKRRGADTAPRAVASPRRGQRSEQQAASTRQRELGQRTLGTVGERPPSPFGGLPVSEIAIFAGIVALVVWLINGGQVTLIIGIALCALGVIEVTAREHFSGYRSHATLLAGIPAIAVGIGLVLVTGEHSGDAPLLFVAVPVFALLFFPLRKRFAIARQARVVRPAAPVKPPPA
jgi:hypothetical protein